MGAPPDSLREVVYYDQYTGEFTWLETITSRQRAGRRADITSPKLYRRIKYEKKEYSAHRVAWWIITGEWPPLQIDHINRNPADNRWRNLRLATNSENQTNTVAKRSGLKGVTVHKQTGRFQAAIKKNGSGYYLGLFDTEEEAHAVYASAAIVLHGKFARVA